MSRDKRDRDSDHFEEGNLTVYVDRPEDFERAVRLFKKLMKRNGILEEVVERQAFTKPSDKKRKKKRDNKYKNSTRE
jgi:ribosomal protein S21